MENRIRRGGVQTPEGFLFELSGGDVSLDLINTVDSRGKELLPSASDFFSWSRQAGLISPGQETKLRSAALRKPKEAERLLRRAIGLRECMYEVFAAVADKDEIPENVLAKWNSYARRAMNQHRLVMEDDRLRWQLKADPNDPYSILWRIVRSGIELLTGPNVSRIRRCANDACDWLFIDTSKRGNRRWCDMTVCGNRAKAKRFYYRNRAKSAP